MRSLLSSGVSLARFFLSERLRSQSCPGAQGWLITRHEPSGGQLPDPRGGRAGGLGCCARIFETMPSGPSSSAAASSFSGSSKASEKRQVRVGAGEQSLKARAALQLFVPHPLRAVAVGVARHEATEVGDAVSIAADDLGVKDAARQAQEPSADLAETGRRCPCPTCSG
jgi:hypothetical protein